MTGRNEVRAFLGLGGNIGDPARAMAAALKALDGHEAVRVGRVSALFRTPPWGMQDQPDFLNAAAEVRTVLEPRALLDLCLDTERALKRERRERWGPRLIDLDILVFGEEQVSEDGLEIPHPRMSERAFVLVPLADIAPDLLVAGHSVADLRDRRDLSGIERMTADGSWWRKLG